jgi:hypothetical protein
VEVTFAHSSDQYYFGRVRIELTTKGVWLLVRALRTMRLPTIDHGPTIGTDDNRAGQGAGFSYCIVFFSGE